MRYRTILWIDILKGIGILSIIFAHTTGNKGVFIYAVPLFFMLSGYLHRPMEDLTSFFMKSVRRMLVPYFVFFLLITSLHVVAADNPWDAFVGHAKLLLWSGNRMAGDFGTFWFVNVLFIALNVFNYMRVRHFLLYVYWVLFLISNGLFLWNVNLPWNIQTLPLVLSYMFVGSVFKQCWSSVAIEQNVNVNKCIFGGNCIDDGFHAKDLS